MDSATNNNNWRNELSHDSRQKIVNKITDTLQRHLPVTGPDGINEVRKIALCFEEKMYAAALDQQDYLRKISLELLSLRNHVSRDGNPLAAVSSTNNANSNNSNNNWRNELSHDSRQRVVNNITDTLQRHMPVTGLDGMNELRKIALRLEEKMYAAALDQQDYLRKISLKMLSLRNHVSRDGNPLAAVSSSSNQKPLDPGSSVGRVARFGRNKRIFALQTRSHRND